MAEENPRNRISAAAALMQVNAVKQNDEYTSCPPKRIVKGKKHRRQSDTRRDAVDVALEQIIVMYLFVCLSQFIQLCGLL